MTQTESGLRPSRRKTGLEAEPYVQQLLSSKYGIYRCPSVLLKLRNVELTSLKLLHIIKIYLEILMVDAKSPEPVCRI